MPADNPTVAKADTVSNTSGKNGSFSVIVNIKIPAQIIPKPNPKIKNAFLTCSSGTALFFMTTVFWLFKNDLKNAMTTAAVFNFIPPAVLPAAPPINIIKIIKSKVEFPSDEKGTVENPAVLSVTA